MNRSLFIGVLFAALGACASSTPSQGVGFGSGAGPIANDAPNSAEALYQKRVAGLSNSESTCTGTEAPCQP